jgi:hypothetical protein
MPPAVFWRSAGYVVEIGNRAALWVRTMKKDDE